MRAGGIPDSSPLFLPRISTERSGGATPILESSGHKRLLKVLKISDRLILSTCDLMCCKANSLLLTFRTPCIS